MLEISAYKPLANVGKGLFFGGGSVTAVSLGWAAGFHLCIVCRAFKRRSTTGLKLFVLRFCSSVVLSRINIELWNLQFKESNQWLLI
ncbi:hypothetical protein BGP75_14945 [Motiliproteus sp. MSK22-1]|nr:hypothetical protein BGP75_14945 [Motiliproteus sp. MSK22-1]